jgi:hypothetical protein
MIIVRDHAHERKAADDPAVQRSVPRQRLRPALPALAHAQGLLAAAQHDISLPTGGKAGEAIAGQRGLHLIERRGHGEPAMYLVERQGRVEQVGVHEALEDGGFDVGERGRGYGVLHDRLWPA